MLKCVLSNGAVFTLLTSNAKDGTNFLVVASITGISAGETIVIDPGQPNSETHVAQKVDTVHGLIVLDAFLTKDHALGAIVLAHN